MTHKSGIIKVPSRAKQLQLTILIPVYNEEQTVLKVLKKATKLPIDNYEILVVDDASRDKSKAIIDKFDKSFDHPNVKLRILAHEKNRGKGAGIKTGLEHAQGLYFIIQDADLEYNPADITPLLKTAIKSDLPVVYGSRFMGNIENMPKPNYFANRFYNFILRRLYSTSITDMHTCYKLVKTDLIRDLGLASDSFNYATELVSKLLKRNIKITEKPITFSGRTKKEGKKIGVKDGIDCIYMLFKYRLNRSL